MTPQERQMIDELFDRLSKVESAPRDQDAANAISQGLRRAPNAVYALVQTVLLQDEALRRAHTRIEELEAGGGAVQPQTGFLDSMRDAIFGNNSSPGSVPHVPPPQPGGNRPVWNSGQVMPQQTQQSSPYAQPAGQYAPSPYGGTPAFGGGSSFLGTAAAAAAGMVGGSLLLGSFRSMMGGQHQSFGDSSSFGGGSHQPWTSDPSNTDLARDAGINDIGSSGNHEDNSRSGFFDQASGSDDNDDMDMDSDGNSGGGDGDYA